MNIITDQNQENTGFAVYEQIKADIAELNASVEGFNQDWINFDKEKKSLAEDIVRHKESEFQQKKIEIEVKKKETKERIKKLKNEIKESSNIDASLIGLDQMVSSNLDKWELELSKMSVATSFMDKVKDSGNRVGNWAERNKKGLLLGGAMYLGYRGLSSLFRKKKKKLPESDQKDGEKKPWYKKWGTWFGVGISGFLGWRYWGDIKNFWNSMFYKEKGQKDIFGEKIVQALGNEWKYDVVRNEFKKGNVIYKWDTFESKGLISIKQGIDGKFILDLEKTVEAIKNYVKEDVSSLPGKHELVNIKKLQDTWSKLDVQTKEKYIGLDHQITGFYKNLYGSENLESAEMFGLDEGFLLFHFDQNFNNLGTILNESTFNLVTDATTKEKVSFIFNHLPAWFGNLFYSVAKGLNFVGFDQAAQDIAGLTDYMNTMKDTELSKLGKLCDYFYQKAISMAFYTLSVRNAYQDKVGNDTEKLNNFEQMNLKDLNKKDLADPDLLNSLENPKVDRSLENNIERLDSRKNKLSKKLASAKNDSERKKIARTLKDEIDAVGYDVWYGAFAMAWGFMRETDKYVNYDIICKAHEHYFSDMNKDIKEILQKNPLTDADVKKLEQNINDFYESLKKLSTETKLRQETDEDGKLFTIMEFPVIRGGKSMYNAFVTYMEDGKYVMAGLTVLAADAMLLAPRSVLAAVRGKKGIFLRLSPSKFIMKKLGKGVFWVVGAGTQYTLRSPARSMNQALNKYRVRRVMTFSTPEKLFEALNKGHIRIEDAAKFVTDKARGKTLVGITSDRFIGENFRKLGFGDDVLHNQRKLLEHNPWVSNNIGKYNAKNAKKYDLLIKNWNKKKVVIARRRGFVGEKLDQLFLELEKGITSTTAPKLDRASRKLNKLGEEVNDLSAKIMQHRAEIEKAAKEITVEFEKELTHVATKKNLKIGSNEYNKLSKEIWESSSYGPKLEGILAKNNNIIMQTEEELMKQFNKSSWKGKEKLVESNQIIKNIVEKNGGLNKRNIPAVGKYGRLVSVGVHAVMLARVGSSKDAQGNTKDRGTIGGEAADFGLGMVPIAGGVYDIGMAVRGKDLNGRTMGTGERWIRGAVGLGTGVLDIFTLGLGGTAIRLGVKGGTKVAVKTGTKALTKNAGAAIVEEGIALSSKGMVKGSAKQLFRSTIRNTVIGTASGIALVPLVGGVREVFISDKDQGTVDEGRETYSFDEEVDSTIDKDFDDLNDGEGEE